MVLRLINLGTVDGPVVRLLYAFMHSQKSEHCSTPVQGTAGTSSAVKSNAVCLMMGYPGILEQHGVYQMYLVDHCTTTGRMQIGLLLQGSAT